jgi:hypothetical protein
MLYRFKSQATADTVMLQASGEQMLTIMGKEVAPQGIVTVAQIPAAIAALEQAVLDGEALEAKAEAATDSGDALQDDGAATDPVRLRQRVAPLITMLKESAAEGKDVVWGV